MTKLLVIFSCIIMIDAICVPGIAQNCGSSSIDSASDMYNTGRFDECINQLNYCLNSRHGFSFDQKIQAYHLLAVCYLAVDSVASADKAIEQLLALKENFEPAFNDPERFTRQLAMIKARPKVVTISSVSKKSE